MKWTSRAGGTGGDGRHGPGREVVRRVLGAGHLVDLDVAGREDSAAVGPRDPPLQPLVVHTAGYVDHFTLTKRTNERTTYS